MNKRLLPYVEYAEQLIDDGLNHGEILDLLKTKGASLAEAIKTVEKLGVELDDIQRLIDLSPVWKGENKRLDELFFEFIELDDDLIDD